ncbi:gamma-glutamyltransferase family protein [Rhizobiaceae bacterium BDR2-2]|uniref:Gamma-glutamyltransferase family protein n=1 Tax=Ectorhizobium quercum TaxID=2965071 RepID=A0AAE3MZS3_9HYPH|nr:gamma-glutamyltransferase family protein [Ectorhizobium quercum]MCX8997954.1 gamma-glutamyltransferase family protein [Ectorhizobium quercum]
MTFTTRPELRGTFGAVATTHWLASAAGMSLLEKGHTAFDAAVAAGFVLQIVEPHLVGPGGEVPIIVTPAGADEPVVISGQGPSPAKATIARFRDLGLDIIPGTGLLPACVPGAFGAWLTLLRDHGTAELEDVLSAAIHYAEHGHPIVPRISNTIASMKDLFTTHWPGSAEIYLPGGAVPQAGKLFRNPQIATLYRTILDHAKGAGSREARIQAAYDFWYRGPVAEAIGDYCARQDVWDVSGRHHRGLLTAQDMADYRPRVEKAVSVAYGDFEVFKCGAWSQGPVLLQMLQILKGTDIADLDPLGADFVHLVVETVKLAMADRDSWYGDSPDVPLDTLLSAAYADARRTLIGETASLDIRPGAPDGRNCNMPPLRTVGTIAQPGLGGGEPTVARTPDLPNDRQGEPSLSREGAQRGDTVYVSSVDRWGNMVSATPSGGWFQSSPVIPGLGFSLTTRGQMFWLEEGLNSTLRPCVRPRTTLTPSMVYRDGRPYMAFGTPGGDQQDQWQLVMFLRHVHAGMNLQEAIDAPSFHTDHLPSSFWPREISRGGVTLEGRFPPQVQRELAAKGHVLTVGDPWSEGRLSAVAREMDGDVQLVKAAANPRGMQGYAVAR